VKHLSGVLIMGRLLALPPNIRLGWIGFPGTSALAYYKKLKLTAVKSFITLSTGPYFVKTFYGRNFVMFVIN
jgi:hypothetical protein